MEKIVKATGKDLVCRRSLSIELSEIWVWRQVYRDEILLQSSVIYGFILRCSDSLLIWDMICDVSFI